MANPGLVWQTAEQQTPMTKKEITDYCTSQFQISITRDWVNSFVLRHSGEVILTQSVTQEDQR
jgi:hypothetical protein